MTMNAEIDNMLHHFFQKKVLEEVNVYDIERIADAYPYYAPVQYLLAKKYLDTNNEAYSKQVKKSAVFFNNPHWLNALLHPAETITEENAWMNTAAITDNETIIAATSFTELLKPAEEVVIATVDEPSTGEKREAFIPVDKTEETIFSIAEKPEPAQVEILDSEKLIEEEHIAESLKPTEEEAALPVESVVEYALPEENPEIFIPKETIDEAVSNTVETAQATEEIAGVVFMEEVNNSADIDNHIQAPPAYEQPGYTYESIETKEKSYLPEHTAIEDEVNNTEPVHGEAFSVEESSSPKLKAILNQPVAPAAENESLIPIEPLYTIDYFASQGIKANLENESKDKLSQKLRSFTDWLKTMKRIHPEKFETDMDQRSQSAIQHIAAHSNESKDIVTEAMAEVFARQGLTQKAAEVYHKLSLLNTDKRVYFAAKIAQLKET